MERRHSFYNLAAWQSVQNSSCCAFGRSAGGHGIPLALNAVKVLKTSTTLTYSKLLGDFGMAKAKRGLLTTLQASKPSIWVSDTALESN